MLYYFEFSEGCGVREYPNIKSARKGILEELGTSRRPSIVRKATEADIAWVTSMGGFVFKKEGGER